MAREPEQETGGEGRVTRAMEASQLRAPIVGKFRLHVVAPSQPARAPWESAGESCAIGSDAGNDLRLAEPTVSGFHCEIKVAPNGTRIVDLGSRNGTIVDGVQVKEAFLRTGSLIKLGDAALRFELADGGHRVPLSDQTSFGGMFGISVAMRASFALMQKAAASDATVLLEGETGTGKGQAAEAIHQTSARAKAPFIVVDCGAIPANLLESELFGHEKGAFTGAESRRRGAFEEATGGTIFLDEIGELPLDLQPKLLRALENRHVRPLGGNVHRAVDVRIIAATNRDLRTEVNQGRFRSDLFFRLSVVRITLPPLRLRPDDLPFLVSRLLRRMGADESTVERFSSGEFLSGLVQSAWPGNVRELRNHLERCLVFEEPMPPADGGEPPPRPTPTATVDPRLAYAEARRRSLDAFEKAYIKALLDMHGGKVAAAARAAGIDRVYLYRLMRRHGAAGGDANEDS